MEIRPLSPKSLRAMRARIAGALCRTPIALALLGCALAFAPGSQAAETFFASTASPLSGGAGAMAHAPGGFEGRAHGGAFAGVTLPLHRDWEVILEGRRDGHDDAGPTLSHQVASRYRLNDAVALRASWHEGSRAPGLLALHASATVDYPWTCDRHPRIGGPEECDRFGEEHAVGRSPAHPTDDTESYRFGATTSAGPLSVSLEWFQVGISEAPIRRSGLSAIHPEARRALPSGGAEQHGRDILARLATPVAGSADSETTGIDIHARTGWKSYWADVALDTRWLHLTRHEDRVAGELPPGEYPRNHVHASLRAERSGFSAKWKVHAVSGFWDSLRNARYAAWIGHDITFRKRDAFGLRGVDLVGGVLNLRNRGSSTASSAFGATGASETPSSAAGRTLFLSASLSLDS